VRLNRQRTISLSVLGGVGSVVAGWTIERVEGGLVTLIDPSGQRVQRSAEPISQARRSVVRVAGEKAAADR
jgi:hypothetical protein